LKRLRSSFITVAIERRRKSPPRKIAAAKFIVAAIAITTVSNGVFAADQDFRTDCVIANTIHRRAKGLAA
jgi:hypothetical protein